MGGNRRRSLLITAPAGATKPPSSLTKSNTDLGLAAPTSDDDLSIPEVCLRYVGLAYAVSFCSHAQ